MSDMQVRDQHGAACLFAVEGGSLPRDLPRWAEDAHAVLGSKCDWG
eukprot:CAMPEP_0175640842 /NCGR_PEP_ID=MMETSP0097-20121207/4454_1 /TAXON_ID=311494 /ORGANISM="Alexandrium monilatum, Strain CCMP3105" /LENGTH=45 /DNA_ID= /DNA_START= /DNA_END= /DNA_ORIENTATION=